MLAASSDARDLARRLGAYCLDHVYEIAIERSSNSVATELITYLEEIVRAIPRELWLPEDEGTHLSRAMTQELSDGLDLLEPTPHLACLAMLRGICVAVLVPWFHASFDVVRLERGDPFPLPDRATNAAIEDTTAYFSTTRYLEPLTGFNFGIYSGGLGPVDMTFEAREELDAACWITDPSGFPTIATLHPYASRADMQAVPDEVNDSWWFGVRPTASAWDVNYIIRQLRDAAAESSGPPCRIAVLPELSVADPDQLAELVRDAWTDLPALIVLGSSHVSYVDEDRAVRANESRIYLRGAELFRYRKRHPFQTRAFSPDRSQPLPEGITHPPRFSLASGTATRLAVAICSDAMDTSLIAELHSLGVNLLLVPALSPDLGSFTLALSGIPSASQGVCVIVNGTPPGQWSEPLFMVLASVPRKHPDQQWREFFPPSDGSRCIVGLFDANLPLADSISWL
jgi:hypothetical protein